MKKLNHKHIVFIIFSSLITFMLIALIVSLIIKSNRSAAENWTRTFSRFYLELNGRLNEHLFFSVFEYIVIVGIISIIGLITWSIVSFVKKDVWTGVNKLMLIALLGSSILTSYNVVVGPAYKRKALPIQKYKDEVKKEELKEVASYFVNDWNYCADQLSFNDKGEIIMPYKKTELIKKLREEYKKLDGNDYFNKYTPTMKSLILSGFFTANGVVGIFYGPTGEAHFNTYSTNAELPFYMAHEMAHGKGVMREDDAQLVATYICLNSEDPLLRYSVYYNTIDSMIDLVGLTDDPNDKKEVKQLIGYKVRNNSKYIYEHWKGKYFLADLGDKINDWYLKTFGQKSGTNSYQDTDAIIDVDDKIYLSNYQNTYFNNYYKKQTF